MFIEDENPIKSDINTGAKGFAATFLTRAIKTGDLMVCLMSSDLHWKMTLRVYFILCLRAFALLLCGGHTCGLPSMLEDKK